MEVLARQFTKREKVLLVLLAILIVGVAYFKLVHEPVTESVENSTNIINTLNTENSLLYVKAERKRQMLSEVDNILQGSNAQEIPAYDNLSQLTAFLNEALKQSQSYDITCGNVQFEENSNIVRRPVQILCIVKDYETAEKIINDIATCPFCSQISNASFLPYNAKEVKLEDRIDNVEDGEITLNLTMTFYEAR